MVTFERRRLAARRPDTVVAAPPGTLQAPPDSVPTTLSAIAYGPDGMTEVDDVDFDQLRRLDADYPVLWVNAVGLGSLDVLTRLGEMFGLHKLALEDVLNAHQRPKVDDYDDHQYIVARQPLPGQGLETEQLSIFLGASFVLTIQEKPGDQFDSIRRRVREGRPRLRNGGADYLAYAIIDALVDAYFPIIDQLGRTLDEFELQLEHAPGKGFVERLYSLKRDMISLRRFLFPVSELISILMRPDNAHISDDTRVYLRDCLDHSVHAAELVDSHRDVASGLIDLHLSLVSQRMNEVMKVLTFIATIFIPLSFIAGLYGMNFNPTVSRWNMPELNAPLGYPIVLGVMTLCAVGMVIFFWKKGWFR